MTKLVIGNGYEAEIIKKYGLFGFLNKAVNHLPKVCARILAPIRHPKQEKYSNEWI